jgi:tetratricopeptide (TPR) repeat protein
VFRYKGQTIDPIKVGQDLKVRAVLTGRVLQRGDMLSIQAELVDTQNGGQLWFYRFNRRIADIFAVQEEISLQISEALKLKLTGEEQRRITVRRTENLAAHNAYLQGLFHLNARTGADIGKAIGYFNESMKKDPKYALAYAGLAYSYALLGSVEYGGLSPGEAIPRAEAAAKQAIELDEDLADAHAVMAFAHLYYYWNFPEAEAEFLRAIHADPRHTTAHHWYAEFLAAMERWDEAFEAIQVAQATDPLSLIINTAEGRIHYWARRHDAAADRLVSTLTMDGNFVMAQITLGLVYGAQGRHSEAEAWFNKASVLTGGAGVVRMGMAYNFALAGNTEGSLQIAKDLSEEKSYVSPAYLAAIYAGLGNKNEAFRLLDQAVDERSGSLVFLNVEPIVDKLRSDPRFDVLLRRVGLRVGS